MTDLTEDSLTKMLEEMRQMMRDRREPIALKPTKMIFRPADLERLGLTPSDVLRMIENET